MVYHTDINECSIFCAFLLILFFGSCTGFSNDRDDIDLRINSDNMSCKEPSCVKCKAEVSPNFDPIECQESHINIKNESCFLCKHKCLTFQDLLVKPGRRFRCPRPVKIDCCILSVMGIMANFCGPAGRYSCYSRHVHRKYKMSVHEPICLCPAGSKARQCRPPYTETAVCRCYRSAKKFCGQEKITNCENIQKRLKKCQMNIWRSDEKYNCLCQKYNSESETDAPLTHCKYTDPGLLNN